MGSCWMARVQSAYLGRGAKGLRRSRQWSLSLEMEVRFVGWVRVRLGVRFGVWGIGDAKEMRERNADSARIG